MEYVERVPLPEVCLGCEDRAGCLARGRESGAARVRASAGAVRLRGEQSGNRHVTDARTEKLVRFHSLFRFLDDAM